MPTVGNTCTLSLYGPSFREYWIKSEYEVVEYLRLAFERLYEAYILLYRGALDEAAEKAWRAFVMSIKAITAYLWQLTPESHHAIQEAIEILEDLGLEIVTRDHYGVANELHEHFYKLHLRPSYVKSYIRKVKEVFRKVVEFIQKLEKLRYIPSISTITLLEALGKNIQATIPPVDKILIGQAFTNSAKRLMRPIMNILS